MVLWLFRFGALAYLWHFKLWLLFTIISYIFGTVHIYICNFEAKILTNFKCDKKKSDGITNRIAKAPSHQMSSFFDGHAIKNQFSKKWPIHVDSSNDHLDIVTFDSCTFSVWSFVAKFCDFFFVSFPQWKTHEPLFDNQTHYAKCIKRKTFCNCIKQNLTTR